MARKYNKLSREALKMLLDGVSRRHSLPCVRGPSQQLQILEKPS